MNERINPFANLHEPPVFTTKPKKDKPVEEDAIAHMAEQHNFPSRQAPKAPKLVEKRKPRVYRTGRNQQIFAKVTAETLQRFYKAAEAKDVTLGELVKQALDALEVMDTFSKAAAARQISLSELTRQALAAVQKPT